MYYLYGLASVGTTSFKYIGITGLLRTRAGAHRQRRPHLRMSVLVVGPMNYIAALEGPAIRAYKTHWSSGGLNQNYGLGFDAMTRYDPASEDFIPRRPRYSRGEVTYEPFGVYESSPPSNPFRFLHGTVDGPTSKEVEARLLPTRLLVEARKAGTRWYTEPSGAMRLVSRQSLDRPERNVSLETLRRLLRADSARRDP